MSEAPTARAKSGEVLALKAKGVGVTEIAKQIGISRKSVSHPGRSVIVPATAPIVVPAQKHSNLAGR